LGGARGWGWGGGPTTRTLLAGTLSLSNHQQTFGGCLEFAVCKFFCSAEVQSMIVFHVVPNRLLTSAGTGQPGTVTHVIVPADGLAPKLKRLINMMAAK
jgi:hypothetical protein